MPDYFTAKNGNLFIQPDGPNTTPVPLGCHDLGDITEPLGDVSQRYYLDANGNYVPILESQGVPGRVTTSITTFLGTVRDELERIRCPFPLYINRAMCGRKDIFLNYDRGEVLTHSRVTTRTRSNNASREGSDATEQAFEISAASAKQYFPLTLSYNYCAGIEDDLYDICFLNDDTCSGACGPASAACNIGFCAGSADAGLAAHVYYTLNKGATWTPCAGVPFAANEWISCVECFYMSRDTVRVLVARLTTDAGNPAEIAYSDNYGTTWVPVNVGAVVGSMFGSHSIACLDSRHLWAVPWDAVSHLGIYFSDDGGSSWTEIFAASTYHYMRITFLDEFYGLVFSADPTALLHFTVDGGAHWSATGALPLANVAYDVEMVDSNRWWICYATGALYYTKDGGTTWTRRYLPIPPPATQITLLVDIKFIDEQCGFLTGRGEDATALLEYGLIYRTFDGGFTWEPQITAQMIHALAPYGLMSLHACDYNHAYAVGTRITATATIVEVSG